MEFNAEAKFVVAARAAADVVEVAELLFWLFVEELAWLNDEVEGAWAG